MSFNDPQTVPGTDNVVTERKGSSSSVYSNEKAGVVDPELQEKREVEHDNVEVEEARSWRKALYARYRPFILGGVAAVILGWWISATVLKATRHRWYGLCSRSLIVILTESPRLV